MVNVCLRVAYLVSGRGQNKARGYVSKVDAHTVRVPVGGPLNACRRNLSLDGDLLAQAYRGWEIVVNALNEAWRLRRCARETRNKKREYSQEKNPTTKPIQIRDAREELDSLRDLRGFQNSRSALQPTYRIRAEHSCLVHFQFGLSMVQDLSKEIMS